MNWIQAHDVPNPAGLQPCRYCHQVCAETEQVDREFGSELPAIRICVMCDQAWEIITRCDKDSFRTTGFQSVANAVNEWNHRFGIVGADPL